MSSENHDDELFRRLDRLMAMAKMMRRDRRLVLSLENDLRALRTALQFRRDALVQRLNIAGAGSKAVAAYSRIACLRSGTAAATTIK
ncbi:hypothetical protein ACF1BQ_018975 [Bradyrhizobium sp. RDT10]